MSEDIPKGLLTDDAGIFDEKAKVKDDPVGMIQDLVRRMALVEKRLEELRHAPSTPIDSEDE